MNLAIEALRTAYSKIATIDPAGGGCRTCLCKFLDAQDAAHPAHPGERRHQIHQQARGEPLHGNPKMSNHPNRSKLVTPAQIVAMRGDMTQTFVARLWRISLRTVQRWEAGEIRPSHATEVAASAGAAN